MQTCVFEEFSIFGQYADMQVRLDPNMRAQMGFPTGGRLSPCSFRRLNPEVTYIADGVPPLKEPINNDRVTIVRPPWGDGQIYELTMTPEEYVVLDGKDVWGKSVKQRYIGCIASVQFNYPNQPDPTTCYTVIPFRPIEAHEIPRKAWRDKEITINWGGIISMNSEHAV